MKAKDEFEKVLSSLNDRQFWAYVSGWYDEQHILDVMNEWDDEIKKEAIKEMKKIKKNVR